MVLFFAYVDIMFLHSLRLKLNSTVKRGGIDKRMEPPAPRGGGVDEGAGAEQGAGWRGGGPQAPPAPAPPLGLGWLWLILATPPVANFSHTHHGTIHPTSAESV